MYIIVLSPQLKNIYITLFNTDISDGSSASKFYGDGWWEQSWSKTRINKNLHQTSDKKTHREDVKRSFFFVLFFYPRKESTKSTCSGYQFWTPILCISVTGVFYVQGCIWRPPWPFCSHDFWVIFKNNHYFFFQENCVSNNYIYGPCRDLIVNFQLSLL